jgi:DNA-binding beta-propeller fold protein YncE
MNRRTVLRSFALSLPALYWKSGAIQSANGEAGRFPTTVLADVERLFSTPGPQPNGLQATSDGLWILDQKTNRVSLVAHRDGKLIRELGTETDRGSGITFDGSALWIASTYNRLLLKVDAQSGKTLKRFDSPGSGIVKWGSRGPNPTPTGAHGLEHRGGRLWVAVPPSATIYVIDPENGTVLRSFPAPGVRPHGLAWDPDGALWCAESNYRSFFKMSPETGRISGQIMLPPTKPEVNGAVIVPHGLTVWDKHLWFCVAETAEVYRFPIPG